MSDATVKGICVNCKTILTFKQLSTLRIYTTLQIIKHLSSDVNHNVG